MARVRPVDTDDQREGAGPDAERATSSTTRRIEAVLALAALAVLVAGCFLVLRPFFTALLWAIVLTFSTWPLYERLTRLLGGARRSLAALLMTLALAAALLLPLIVVSSTIAENATRATDLVRDLLANGPPAPPSWVVRLPVVGEQLAATWAEFAADSQRFAAFVQPWLVSVRGWAIGSGLAAGAELVEVTLGVVVSFFLYRDGAEIAAQVQVLSGRVVGDRAQHLLQVAGATVRGVVYGIVGTSLIQGALATVGYYAVGAPGFLFLGLLTTFLAFFPSGPPLVWGSLAIWLLTGGHTASALFLAVWGFVVVGSVDHFLKPLLISRESNMPILLIFFGVVGGAFAFGVMGVFLGPVLLAVAFSLVRDWVRLSRRLHRPAEPV